MTTIPHARGLTEELSSRVQNLRAGEAVERMAPDGIHKVIQYDVFDNERRLGVVEVNSWDFNGITQIEHVAYEGVIPGYNEERVIGMTATAEYTLSPGDPESTHLRWKDHTEPNDTWKKPLYRHDGHALRLADYEVPGKEKHRMRAMEEAIKQEERRRL